MRILLVEDDQDIVRMLSELLIKTGYEVTSTDSQDEALALALHTSFDLVLLDVTLRQGNGFAVCSALKAAKGDLPIIFLTASDDEFNTVAGLSMGADDYIAKPFRPRELLARIEATLRRSSHSLKRIPWRDIVVDVQHMRALKAGCELELSAVEYRLLVLFATHQGSIVTREMIKEVLYENSSAVVEDNTLAVYIKRLRQKIGDDVQHPTYIKTIRGLGYRSCE